AAEHRLLESAERGCTDGRERTGKLGCREGEAGDLLGRAGGALRVGGLDDLAGDGVGAAAEVLEVAQERGELRAATSGGVDASRRDRCLHLGDEGALRLVVEAQEIVEARLVREPRFPAGAHP